MFVEFKIADLNSLSSRKDDEEVDLVESRAEDWVLWGWLPISPPFLIRVVELVIVVGALDMDMSVAPPFKLRICVIVRLGLSVVSWERGMLRTGCEDRAEAER